MTIFIFGRGGYPFDLLFIKESWKKKYHGDFFQKLFPTPNFWSVSL